MNEDEILDSWGNYQMARMKSGESRKKRQDEIGEGSNLFKRALSFDMPQLRRAEILANVALTYLKENNAHIAYSTAEKAMDILQKESVCISEVIRILWLTRKARSLSADGLFRSF